MQRSIILSVALLISACGADKNAAVPVTPAQVGATTSNAISSAVGETSDALSALSDSNTFQSLTTTLRNTGSTLSNTALSGLGRQVTRLAERMEVSRGRGLEDANAPSSRDQTRIFLDSNVFIAANIESKSDTDVVYLLHGTSLCAANDTNCISNVDAAQLRLDAHATKTTLTLDLLIGPQKVKPASLTISNDPNTITFSADLGAVKSALAYLERKLPTVAPTTLLPDTFSGVVAFSVATKATQDVTLSTSVTTAIAIADPNHSIAVGVAAPLLTAHITSGAADLALTAAALDIGWPYADLVNLPTGIGSVNLHVPGATLALQLDGTGSGGLLLKGLGMGNGTTTLTHSGTQLLGIDLNAATGRAVDVLVVSSTTQEGASFTFTPGLTLALNMHLADVATDEGRSDPASMWNNDYTIALAGSGSASLTPQTSGIEVTSGSLTLTATGASVTVATQQCLVSAGDDNSPTTFLSDFASASCQ